MNMSKIFLATSLAIVCTTGVSFAEVTQTSGTGRDWNALCKKDGVACSLTGSGGGIDTYSACTSSQCYTVSCSSEDQDRTCIKEESPSRRVGTKNRQAVRRLLGAAIVRSSSSSNSANGGGGAANSGNGNGNVGSAAPSGPTKGDGGGCSGGVC
jgi:hypothetical protein